MGAPPVPILGVNYPGFAGMQPQPDLFHPAADRFRHGQRLGVTAAVHHRIVDIAFEGDAWELPGHPPIERVVQEQIREHG